MEIRKLAALTAAMTLANMTAERDLTPHHSRGKHEDPPKPTKNRSKIKAARKQNRSHK